MRRRVIHKNRLLRRAAVARWRAERRFREEVANSVTHGLGLALALIAAPVLVALGALRGTAAHVTGFTIYGGALILLYAASTFFHAFYRRPRLYRLFHTLDHMAIFLMIAGSYTPIMLVSVNGPTGWMVLLAVWMLALAGMVYKVFFTGKFQRLSLVLYIGLGWMVILIIQPIMEALPPAGFYWLVAGGLCYTAGVVFFTWTKLPYHHAIWHLFVLAGSICHYVAMIGYVV